MTISIVKLRIMTFNAYSRCIYYVESHLCKMSQLRAFCCVSILNVIMLSGIMLIVMMLHVFILNVIKIKSHGANVHTGL
jgi:hypothetical protein